MQGQSRECLPFICKYNISVSHLLFWNVSVEALGAMNIYLHFSLLTLTEWWFAIINYWYQLSESENKLDIIIKYICICSFQFCILLVIVSPSIGSVCFNEIHLELLSDLAGFGLLNVVGHFSVFEKIWVSCFADLWCAVKYMPEWKFSLEIKILPMANLINFNSAY